MRHGHAEEGNHDHARSLTDRGRAAAEDAGRRIAALAFGVDQVLCSDASRAHETAEIVRDRLGRDVPLRVVPELYHASSDGYLEVLRDLPPNVECVVLVAHNPAISALARRLAGNAVSMSPADFAVGASDVADWSALG